MSWLAYKLKHRIQIQKPTQTPNDNGGFDRGYETLTTVWAGIKELNLSNTAFVSYIRGAEISEISYTHEFIVRYVAVKNIGKSYASGFAGGFDSVEDLNPLKNDTFIFLQNGSTVKGRLFKVTDVKRDDDRKEYFRFRAKEIEEHGTGYAE